MRRRSASLIAVSAWEWLRHRDAWAAVSNREIGKALYVAEGTVKNHVSKILAKLGVRDRTRAVLKAVERGCV